MISIPTVDQLIDSALDADNFVPDQEKVAAVRENIEQIDDMEKMASELENWADGIDSVEVEQTKVASDEKHEDARHRMLKLAMVGTAYRTLRALEENGQLDGLVEKNAQIGKWLIGRARRGVGSVVAKRSKVSKAAKAITGKGLMPTVMSYATARGLAATIALSLSLLCMVVSVHARPASRPWTPSGHQGIL